ncbi:MAG: undecaprenyldiphospho-muramoylpentapeptide beta-N-acetylglucosaminyltransferase [Anaerolineales bacterium]|nr:undecaprenyldiphospho-muramoylpentapeptide beta-N-acetylglucosaminyltransferase [Anaerolineales bacterium]
MRLLICAGGTGGGVNPALAVLQSLTDKAETLWVGGEDGMEARLVERAGVPFKAIPAAGLHGVGLHRLPGNLWRLLRGVFAARRVLDDFQPDVLLFTGGYVAVPMALAGRRVPSVLYVPDIEPGLALKTLARFASRICLTVEESTSYFRRPERLAVTGYPVRRQLTGWTRANGRQAIGLAEELPVLLVTGGSKGARSINHAVLDVLPELLELTQVVHITGELDWPEVEARTRDLNETQARRYFVFPYLHEEMGAVLAAADLAVSRGGASALGEYPLFGLPAVLVPYPYAWRYQKVNADYLTHREAAVTIADQDLGGTLLPTIRAILQDPARLDSMRSAMRQLAHPEAAQDIGQEILALAEKRS